MMVKKRKGGTAAVSLLSVFFIFVLLFTFGGIPVKAAEMSEDDKAAVRDYLYETLVNGGRQADIPEQYDVPLENLDAIISDMRSVYSNELYNIEPRYSYTCENGRVSRVLFRENDYQSEDVDADMQSVVRDALSYIKADMSDAQKVVVLHDWLALHCEYDYEAQDKWFADHSYFDVSFTAYGALVNRMAVCDGYTKAYKYLLKQVGINSYKAATTEDHAWNVVELDGKYYHVDVTHDDMDDPLIPHSISHAIMLKSDSHMKTTYGYSDWKVYGSTVTLECDDTRYDNLSWGDAGDHVWDGDTYYYTRVTWKKGGVVGKVTLKDDKPEEEILNTWEVPGEGLSDIFRSGDRLYYNTLHEIRSMAMGGTDDRLEYDLDNKEKQIYRISLQDGKLCYKQSGLSGVWQETDIALEEEPEPLLDIFDHIKEIRFDYDEMVLQTGETFEVGVKQAYIREFLKWNSDNPSVVTIDQNGKLTAVSEGEAVITASDTGGNVLGSLKVSVLPGMQEGDIAGGSAWNLVWRIDADGTLLVEGDGGRYPSYYDMPWSKCRDIKAAKFEVTNLTGINHMFIDNLSLQSVDLAGTDLSNVTNMQYMFKGCSSLQSVDLAGTDLSNVTSMQSMFEGCQSLQSVDLTGTNPSNVTNMQWMFYNCNALEEVTSGDAFVCGPVTNMEGMFRNCYCLEEIDLSALDLSHVTNMNFMFGYCSGLTKVNFGTSAMDQVTGMNYMFAGCTSLEEIELDISADGGMADTDTGMRNMFYGCSALKRAVLSTFRATDMGRMFEGCKSLETIDISGLDLSKADFTCMLIDCDNLTSIAVPANIAGDISLGSGWKDENGVETGKAVAGLAVPMTYTRVIIPVQPSTGATEEWKYKFINDRKEVEISSYIGSDTSITIPDEIEGKAVTSIGKEAFIGCTSLTSITIPEGVTNIGNWAFYGCSSLSSIEIPEGVTGIGDYAFNGCSGLTSVIIPGSVTNIGHFAFNNCSKLSSLEISEGVITIGQKAFYGCSSLTSVIIPDSVTDIGHFAFYGCSKLSSVEIPEGVTSIGDYAFTQCADNLTIYVKAGSYADTWAKTQGYKTADIASDPIPDNPNTGNPNTGNPNTGNPNTGNPNTGNPNTGNPNTGNPNTGNPNTGNPNTGNPNTGNPNTGNPNTGNPNTGNPNTGNPNTGNPNTGNPNTGNPNAGNQNAGNQNSDNEVTIPKVAKVTKFKAVAKKKGFTLSWKKVSGANGYEIQVSTKKNFKGAKTYTINKNKAKYTISKLKGKKKYYIRIRAYKNYKDANGKTKKAYGTYVSVNKKTK